MESIVILVGAISGSVVSIIYAVFSSIRKSRCVECKCCGVTTCTRDVMNENEMKLDYNMGVNLESGLHNGRVIQKTAPFIHTPFSREVEINKQKKESSSSELFKNTNEDVVYNVENNTKNVI